MALFPQYQVSSRSARREVVSVERIGLLPVGLALMLMWARRGAAGPGLWAAFGLALGMELLLAGAYELHHAGDRRSRPGDALAARSDRWFPLLVFAAQSGFVALSVLLLWTTVCELGFPAGLLQHALLVALLLAVPAYRAAAELVRESEGERHHLAAEFFRYLLISVGAVFAAGVLARIIGAPDGTPVPEMFPIVLVLWVAASLTVLSCLALFLDHALRPRE